MPLPTASVMSDSATFTPMEARSACSGSICVFTRFSVVAGVPGALLFAMRVVDAEDIRPTGTDPPPPSSVSGVEMTRGRGRGFRWGGGSSGLLRGDAMMKE